MLAALLAAPFAHAEMTALDDEQLSDVQGAGIGFVLDSAMVDGNKATIAINGVTNTATGQNVPITVKELYVAATGSNKGSTLAPVTLGRLNFPFKLNLAKGSVLTTQLDDGRVVSTLPDTADVIELAFPSLVSGAGGQPCIAGYAGAGSNCSSRASERSTPASASTSASLPRAPMCSTWTSPNWRWTVPTCASGAPTRAANWLARCA